MRQGLAAGIGHGDVGSLAGQSKRTVHESDSAGESVLGGVGVGFGLDKVALDLSVARLLGAKLEE